MAALSAQGRPQRTRDPPPEYESMRRKKSAASTLRKIKANTAVDPRSETGKKHEMELHINPFSPCDRVGRVLDQAHPFDRGMEIAECRKEYLPSMQARAKALHNGKTIGADGVFGGGHAVSLGRSLGNYSCLSGMMNQRR